ELASPDSLGSALHHKNSAKPHLAVVHSFVGLRPAAKRKLLDHGMHVAQCTEFQSVLRVAGGAGIPARDLPAAHQQRHHAHSERIVRRSRNQEIAIYTQSTDDVRDRLRAWTRRKNHSRAAELLQFSHRIDGGRIDVMVRAEFFASGSLSLPCPSATVSKP